MTLTAPIVIFVRPIAHGNVGALARVMSNFNVSELRLVKSPSGEGTFDKEDHPLDWGLACRGEKILKGLQIFDSLSEALHDVHFVVGTTARPREKDSGYSRPVFSFDTILEKLALPATTHKKWALVLGAEDDGLSDEETSLCHLLSSIPTSAESSSMNVAMAAGCLLYHWSLRSHSLPEIPPPKPPHDLATAADLDKLSHYILETLKLSEFFKYPDQTAVLARLRRIFQNNDGGGLPRGELLFAFEIFYQLRSKILGRFEDRNFLTQTKPK